MAESRWRQFLVAGLVGVVAVWFAPITLQPILTLVLSAVALVAMRRGTRAWAGEHARPWNLLRAGGAMFIVAQLVRAGHTVVTGEPKPFPSPADPVFYLGYALLISGVVSLVRRRRAQVEGDNLLDALIVVTCVGVFATAYVLQPYVESIYLTNLQKALSVAYTLCDLVLIAVTVRLAVGSGRRPASYYLLGCAWVFALLADALVTIETMGILLGPWTFVTSALSYVFLATSAMHPSMAQLAERPQAQGEVRLTRGRLALLFVAMAMVPGMLAWATMNGHARVTTYAVGSVVMAMLVLGRLAGLVRSKERKAEREAVLREAASSFAGTLDAEGMLRVAVSTLGTMVGAGDNGRASLAIVEGDALRVVTSVGLCSDAARGVDLDIESVPAMAEAIESRTRYAGHVRPVDLREPGDQPWHVLMVPLVAREEVRGVFVVTVPKPVPFEVVGAVGSLADQLSVALEANALADEISRRKHERRFRALVENGSDLVTLVDAVGTVFFASPACAHLLGVTEEDMLGGHPFARVHPDDRYLAGSLLDAVWSESREGEPIEARFRHADGSWRWFEVVADNLLDEPDVAGVVVHFREITDRKQAELELQESAARFRSLVQHASDLVVVLDGEARLTYVSPSVVRVLGYMPEEIMGTSGLLLIHPDDVGLLPASQEPFPPFTREVRVRRRNGDWAIIEFTASDLRREPGVEGVVLNGRDVTDRKTLEAELRRLALHDGLTGLPNRTLFLDRVEQALSREVATPLAVLYVDLDDFKTINDGLGHVAGDTLLRAVAGRLSGCVRGQDTAARLGGDEFGVLLDGIEGAGSAAEIARRIGDALVEPFVVEGRQLHVTATVGYVVRSDEQVTTEVLLRRADVAMYLAKTRGKNRVQAYEHGMDEQFRERLELKGDLSAALEQEQFRLVYQPIVSLEDGGLEGFEALVRWQHPERGLVPPNVFVPIAEETGDIVLLGEWVLRTACDQLARWHASYPGLRPRMSVNLSVRQLEHPGLISTVRSAVTNAGIAPGDLTLEITESVIAQDVAVVRAQLNELQDLGVKVAIDDFGTGYSSFGYLSQFSVDVLKIDRSFVMDLTAVDGEQADIIRAIVSLAQSRGLRTVAEGIEETVQADVLRALGCDTGQGYLFSRPAAPADLEDLLRSSAPELPSVPVQRARTRSRSAVA